MPFVPPKDFDCNYHNEYGWWLTNLSEVSTIEEYAERYPESYQREIARGMNLAIGPSPDVKGWYALYCTNYDKVVTRPGLGTEKTTGKGK